MRRSILVSLTVLISFFGVADSVIAQLPDGSIAPDFVIEDIDGNEHHLYSYLDDGKSVILFFMAPWSGPDWSYHNSGTLQSVYNDYGPGGSNQLVVLLLNADDNTSIDDLYGTGDQSTGNFVEGTPFPVIDDAESIFNMYEGGYYPTIFTICPDQSVVQSGQVDYDTHVSIALDGCGYYAVGCTDPNACNFFPAAQADDGSCDYCFCGIGTIWSTSISQCIPSSEACGEGTIWDDVSKTCVIDQFFCAWQPDGDGDMLIGVSDLLMLLAVFGDTDLDQDGIFDSADDCVGSYDECGVCNGDGPSIPVIESIEVLYDSVYAEAIDEWWVFEVGADTTFTLLCELYGCTDPTAENFNEEATNDDGSCIYPWACGDPVSYHGYDYETVLIGEQCWFAENLRTELYQNGDTIRSDLLEAGYAAEGAQCVYGEEGVTCESLSPEINACNSTESLAEYGRLYNWYAVDDIANLCPASWHVPNDNEWTTMANFLGGRPVAGMKIKTTHGWSDDGEGDDSSGFSGLPSGVRASVFFDMFTGAGNFTGWWTTSTSNDSHAWYQQLEAEDSALDHGEVQKNYGLSVRCIKD